MEDHEMWVKALEKPTKQVILVIRIVLLNIFTSLMIVT